MKNFVHHFASTIRPTHRTAGAVTAAAALLLGAGTTRGQLVVYEGFNYPYSVFGNPLSGKTGGIGWDSTGWSSPTNWRIAASGMKYSDVSSNLTTAGNSARFSAIGSTSAERTFAAPLGTGNQTMWVSFLADIDHVALTTLAKEVEFTLVNGVGGLTIGKDQSHTNWSVSGGAITDYVSTAGRNQVYAVARIDFHTNSPEDVYVWFNPPLDAPLDPSTTTPNVTQLAYVELSGMTGVRIHGNVQAINGVVRVDEVRIGATFPDVAPSTANPAYCKELAHGLRLHSDTGGLSSADPEERFKEVAKARSRRRCHNKFRNPTSGSAWSDLPGAGPYFTQAFADPSLSSTTSWAYAESNAAVGLWTDNDLNIDLITRLDGRATRECSTSNRGKAAKSVSRSMHKARVRDLPSSIEPWWAGLFRNCKATTKRSQRLTDPVDVVVNLPGGPSVRYPIIDISSHVWDGETAWYAGDGMRFLSNTARRMQFTASISSPLIPPSQHGYLSITTNNGVITSRTATGIFAPMLSTLPDPNNTSNNGSGFTVPFPAMTFTLNQNMIPPGATIDIDGGGGSREDDLGPDTIIGCNIATDLFKGIDEADLSTPQNGDTTLGFPIGAGTHRIVQEITIPASASPSVIESVAIHAYQQSMPESSDPTVGGGTLSVYDGPPWLGTTNLLFSTTTLPVAGELLADWSDIHRVAPGVPDTGDKPVFDISLVGSDNVVVQPGDHLWFALDIIPDSSFAEPHAVPCPFDSGVSWAYDAGTSTWAQLFDAGSGRPVSFGLDIVLDEPPVDCDSIDFNDDGLFPDTLDIDDFLNVFSGGPCSNDPNCGDIDFNNDGLFPDTMDIDALLSVFSGGPCLL